RDRGTAGPAGRRDAATCTSRRRVVSSAHKGVILMRATFCDVRFASVALTFPGLFCLLIVATSASARPVRPRLEIPRPVSNDWVRLSSSSDLNTVITLQASSNLLDWQWVGTLHDGLFNYPDAASPNSSRRFYRLLSNVRGSTNDWKGQILFPNDPFLSPAAEPSDVPWVKFVILLNDPVRVVYQER